MNFLHSEFDLKPNQLVQVALMGHSANVMLLDEYNYGRYKESAAFSHYGGHYSKSPVTIRAPYTGHWHVVVDTGGGEGDVKASITVISDRAA